MYKSRNLPISAVLQDTGPSSSDHSTWSATCHACGGVDATVPYGIGEELVFSESLICEQEE